MPINKEEYHILTIAIITEQVKEQHAEGECTRTHSYTFTLMVTRIKPVGNEAVYSQ